MYNQPFNLKSIKKDQNPRPIDIIRNKCPEIRPNDLDIDDNGIKFLAEVFASKKITHQAVHGRGDGWTEVGPSYNPYKTDPLVKSTPEFGGRWRNNFPGSGDQHINDDSDKQKNMKGESVNEDFDPELKKTKINDALKELSKQIKGPGFIVKVKLDNLLKVDKNLAVEIFGQDGQIDENYVFIEVNDFDEALLEERKQKNKGRNVIIETR